MDNIDLLIEINALKEKCSLTDGEIEELKRQLDIALMGNRMLMRYMSRREQSDDLGNMLIPMENEDYFLSAHLKNAESVIKS